MLRLPNTTRSRIQLALIALFLFAFTVGVKFVADYFDWTAKSVDLRDAIDRGDLEAVKQLEREGVDWRRLGTTADRYTALHHAVNRGSLDIVQYFVENGADVTAEMTDGITPAGIAAMQGHLAIMKYLLIETPQGESMARTDPSILPIVPYADLELIGWLAARIDLKGQLSTEDAYRLVYRAVDEADTTMVEYLLSIGAPSGMETENWDEGFYRAPPPASANAARWLAVYRPVNAPNPLHLAAQRGYENITILLLEYGANPTRKDPHGKTPIDYARENGHASIATLLDDAINRNTREAE